ncbi:hypothetical protein LG634_36425 [Streptomyces bambusae]|uniref:golvesin C-terminal-like domain-containing protein n=1 Tax=Streptomyces bambusae TaxID=1550616 RepID=UPI001CFFA52F|nr:hypothetical protein [Streptomyces bambusae]MCB5170270.1 hypothetical protein [Streptomyces bambusae]
MKIPIGRLRVPVVAAVATALSISLALPALASAPQPPGGAAAGWSAPPVPAPAKPSAIPAADREKTLGVGYAASRDTAFTTTGDATGFHLLTAAEAKGYGWKTAATLREKDFDADTWIGNACVTASGRRAAVAYAPRTFANKPELMVRGAFTAVVDLVTGKVTKLPFTAALAYFSPGCGNGEQVVFTQLTHDGDKKQRTRLLSVDAATGRTVRTTVRPGQVTSAIPAGQGIVAARGNRLVRFDGDRETELVRTRTVPFQLTADADGGVAFIERDPDRKASDTPQSRAKYLSAAAARGVRPAGARAKTSAATAVTVATGALDAWDLAGSASGRVFITGKAKTAGTLPVRMANPGRLTKGARMSTLGHAATTTAWADGRTSLMTPQEARGARIARTQLVVLATGRTPVLDATPAAGGGNAASGTALSPALPRPASNASGGPAKGALGAVRSAPESPTEEADERFCAVARNNPRKQAFQPTPRQVEWAVNQAVIGRLNLTRPVGWKNTDMGAYTPQSLFPATVLDGDPNGTLDSEDGASDKWHIPSQILLGITAQESNMWQATRFAVPGVTANSLIGNYYGVQYTSSGQQADAWRINWSDADCGYGITQVTDGMRLAGKTKKGETALSPLTQEAVALDYTANIAYGAQILSDKWNTTRRAGMKINDGDPRWIENWFFALWAYNSGFYQNADDAGHRGVGWTNNPANPLWKANRTPFLENPLGGDDYSHAAQPQNWPYQEKVIGWAARPISAMFAPNNFQAGYKAAWWNRTADRTTAKPPVDLFCNASNNCDPGKIGDKDSNDPGMGACTLDSGDKVSNPHWLHCWWNQSASWKNCTTGAQCGNAVHRFDTTYPEQPDGTAYPPRCTSGLPAGTLVVDNLPNGTVPAGSASRSCGAVKSDGTFTFTYQPWTLIDADTGQNTVTYPGKIDTHQIGAGYQNHFWFSHGRKAESFPPPGDRMKVTGTWRLDRPLTAFDGQARVYAHIPDHGAQTEKAEYVIRHAAGETVRTVSQTANQSNKWVDLGAYVFTGTNAEVSLNNFNGGDGTKDIAWDAVAFVPGDYSGIPSDWTFGDPDPFAPDPDQVQRPETIPGRFLEPPSAGSAAARSGKASDTDRPTLSSAPGAVPFVAPAASPPPAGTCSTTQISMTVTRSTACIVSELTITRPRSGLHQAAMATFNYVHDIYTDPRSKVVTQKVTVSLKSLVGAGTTGMDVNFQCSGNCTMSTPVKTGIEVFAPGDRHTFSIESKMTWTGSYEQNIRPQWVVLGQMDGVPTKSTPLVEKDELTVRCDETVLKATAGCVFSRYRPTYTMNSKKFPAAAAHVLLVQTKLPHHFGLKGQGDPLKYLGPDVLKPGTDSTKMSTSNRNTICPTGWAKQFSPTLSPQLVASNTDEPNCDEFPFASTTQSAGMPTAWGGENPRPVKSGDECISTIAMKDPDGVWRLHLAVGPGSIVPTWTETCGRSAMSGNQNQGSMQPFGAFRNDNRLIDGDQYWLDVPKP